MTKRELGGGAIPESFEDDGPDTAVDERPAVPLSPLQSTAEETSVDDAPTIDPTTRRPVAVIRSRPIKERRATPPREAAPPAPPVAAPPRGKLRLPLPTGGVSQQAAPKAIPTPRPQDVAPGMSFSKTATDLRSPKKPVPTYAAEHQRAKWPFALALIAVATIIVAFLVASGEDPNKTTLAQATRQQRARHLAARTNGANAHRSMALAVGADGQPIAPVDGEGRPKAVVHPPKIKAERQRTGMPHKSSDTAPSYHDLSDKGDDQPEYTTEKPAWPTPTLIIQTKPPGAPVFIDDVPVGVTPTTVPLEADRKGGTLSFRRTGFLEKKVPFNVDGPGAYEIFHELTIDEGYEARLSAGLKKNPPSETR